MSFLGALGLDSESPKWQRAVKIQKAFLLDFGAVGFYVEVTTRTEYWIEKIEACVRLIQPPGYAGDGETTLPDQWVKLIRDPARPDGPRTYHDDTGVMDGAEKARLWGSASYYDGQGPIPIRLPDVMEITGLRITLGKGRGVKNIELRRHHAAIATKPPKDWP
nr:hypothetical protein [uncultured Brevundimonas sp.]